MSNTTTDRDAKQVIDFSERLLYALELKINKFRIAIQKSETLFTFLSESVMFCGIVTVSSKLFISQKTLRKTL